MVSNLSHAFAEPKACHPSQTMPPVDISVSNVASGGSIRLQEPNGDPLTDDIDVDDTTDFLIWDKPRGWVNFATPGRKTIQLKLLTNASNGVAGQVDLIQLTPYVWLVGPDQAPPTTTPAQVDDFKHVGTVFAVNLPGAFSELRFWVNDDEYEASDENDTSHFVNLWRIDSSELISGVSILSGTSLLSGAIEVPYTQLKVGWNFVELDPPIEVNPGLYQVSVNLMATPSFSLIQDVVPTASPSVLTLVAGAVNSVQLNQFPNSVFFHKDMAQPENNLPNGYFWLDVTFSQIY